jgi:hypothetical protein
MRMPRLLVIGLILIVVGILGLLVLGSLWSQWPWMYGHRGMMLPLDAFLPGL